MRLLFDYDGPYTQTFQISFVLYDHDFRLMNMTKNMSVIFGKNKFASMEETDFFKPTIFSQLNPSLLKRA